MVFWTSQPSCQANFFLEAIYKKREEHICLFAVPDQDNVMDLSQLK